MHFKNAVKNITNVFIGCIFSQQWIKSQFSQTWEIKLCNLLQVNIFQCLFLITFIPRWNILLISNSYPLNWTTEWNNRPMMWKCTKPNPGRKRVGFRAIVLFPTFNHKAAIDIHDFLPPLPFQFNLFSHLASLLARVLYLLVTKCLLLKDLSFYWFCLAGEKK